MVWTMERPKISKLDPHFHTTNLKQNFKRGKPKNSLRVQPAKFKPQNTFFSLPRSLFPPFSLLLISNSPKTEKFLHIPNLKNQASNPFSSLRQKLKHMGNRFHELPPSKRYKLMQEQEKQNQILHQNQPNFAAAPSCLPAKKRIEPRNFPPVLHDSTTTFCLPAKKRVWAIQGFDLNIEYQLPLEDAQKSEKECQKTDEIQDGPSDIIKTDGWRKERIVGIDKLKEANEDSEGEGDSNNKGGNSVAKKLTEESENGDVDEGDSDDGILCAICESTDGDPSDPIVFCDGCELMVHTSCYGHPFTKGVPDGDWFCARCLASKSPKSGKKNQTKKTISCCLCPMIGGALKPTTEDGQWAHVVCALFVPEVFFRDSEGREGIDMTQVPDRRWKQKCYICKSKNGCAIDCSEPKCPLAFHVTCGLKKDLCIEYTEGRNKTDIVAGFCRTHSDLWQKQQQTGKFKIVARDNHVK